MDLLGDFCFRREADVSARLFERTNDYQERLFVFLLRFFSPLGPRGFLGPVRFLECVFVRLLSEAGRLTFSTDLAAAIAGADAVFIAVGTPARRGWWP